MELENSSEKITSLVLQRDGYQKYIKEMDEHQK